MRSRATRLALAGGAMMLAGLAAAADGCSAPVLPDLPATCSNDAPDCPEGLSCIHDVCAKPGTAVPITIASVGNLRGTDMRLVPQAKTALVTWETYAYSDEGQGFYGARVDAAGDVSPTMTLVSSFEADPGALEPYYDVLPTDAGLLLSVSASPLPDDESPEPRLLTYRVDLPPEGSESSAPSFQAAWDAEIRMPTIGYGAVSRPKLVRSGDGVSLGYFQSLTKDVSGKAETAGELAVFSLKLDGSLAADAPVVYPAREGLTVAVGVVDAFATGGDVWWVLDDERPSVLRAGMGGSAHSPIQRLGIPLLASGDDLTYLEPSKRAGEGLPDDPVSGPASLRKLTLPLVPGGGGGTGGSGAGGAGGGGGSGTGSGGGAPAADEVIAKLPELRDTPRPVFIPREGKPPLLVSPGADLSAPTIGVFTLDTSAGALTRVASVQRFATTEIGGLDAVVVGSHLFVAWIDTSSDAAVIRMAVLPEP